MNNMELVCHVEGACQTEKLGKLAVQRQYKYTETLNDNDNSVFLNTILRPFTCSTNIVRSLMMAFWLSTI
jgi:hypothetical protein